MQIYQKFMANRLETSEFYFIKIYPISRSSFSFQTEKSWKTAKYEKKDSTKSSNFNFQFDVWKTL